MPINPTRLTKCDLSIIIISYNTKKITEECIESVYRSFLHRGSKKSATPDFSWEMIVVDNSSTDGSVATLRTFQRMKPNFTLVENKNNVGFAKANNQAVKIAKGKYLLFLNSDTIVLDRAILKLVNFYRKNEKTISILGGKLFNEDMSPQPSCGPFYSLPVIFGALFMKGDYWGLTRYSPNELKEVDWVSGACILVKKDCFEKINGFDEKIFMYMDEIDFLYRAKKQGYRVFFYPEAKFIHLGSASSGGKTYPILQVYQGFIYFYRKHHSRLSFVFLKIMLQLKALIALTVGKLTGDQYLIKTYGKAYQMAKMA